MTSNARRSAVELFRSALAGFVGSDRLKIARYFVAGVAVSLGYTVTVILLVWLGWLTPPIASAVSFALWTPVSYYAHRDFTFRFEGANAAAVVKFMVAFVLKFIASAGVVYVAMEYFGAHYLFGVLMNWVIGPVINYLVLHFWVFRTRRERHLADSPSP